MNIGAGSRLEGPVLRFGEKMENRLPAADCRKHECRRPALRAAFRCTDRLLAAHDAFEREWTEASAAVWKIHGVFRAGRCRFALLFFRFFRLSNKRIRCDVVYWIVFQAFPCGRNAKVSCIPERAVKISLQRILEGFSNLGFLGSPPPYRMPSRTPFADDRRKLRMDSRRFLDALGRNAGVLKRGRKADDRAASE